MDRGVTHEQVQDLLGAYALDAVDPDEQHLIAEHVAQCPRCASEVAEHHEVAAMLGNVGADAPPAVWDHIASRLERPPVQDRPPRIVLARMSQEPSDQTGRQQAVAEQSGGVVVAPGRLSSARRRRLAWGAGGAVAAAAAALVVALLVQVGQLHRQIEALNQVGVQRGMTQVAQAATLDPSATRIRLASSTNGTAATLVVLPSGTAFFVNGTLAPLPASETYQLWAVVGGQAVSLGLLGNRPASVALNVDPRARITRFAVTAERSTGVVKPTAAPVAVGSASA